MVHENVAKMGYFNMLLDLRLYFSLNSIKYSSLKKCKVKLQETTLLMQYLPVCHLLA